jgi:hypothetical protein
MIAGQMTTPIVRERPEFFNGFVLERTLDFVDAGDRGPDPCDLALVLAADEFWEKPLDHGRNERLELRMPVVGAEGAERESDVRDFMRFGMLE